MEAQTQHAAKEKRMPRGGYRGGHPPKKPEGEKAVTLAIAIAPALRDALKELATSRGVSVSSIAQDYIRRGLEADKSPQQTPE